MGRDRLSKETPLWYNNRMKRQSDLIGIKNYESSVEMAEPSIILDIQGKPIDTEWAAEFRGFFWGEGSLWIQGKAGTYAVRAAISLRSDDKEVLIEFQRRLGGRIFIQPLLGEKLAARWQVSKKEDVARIASLLETKLPFKKAREVPIWKQAIDLRISKEGRHWTLEQIEQMNNLADQLKSLRQFTK
jgi:hypothetical protein